MVACVAHEREPPMIPADPKGPTVVPVRAWQDKANGAWRCLERKEPGLELPALLIICHDEQEQQQWQRLIEIVSIMSVNLARMQAQEPAK
jgi:hypothetical protein